MRVATLLVLALLAASLDASSEDAVYEGPGDVRTENRLTYDISLGSTVTVTISHQFMSDSGFGCFLKTPQGDVITFRPTSDNNNSNEDLVLQPVSMMSDCSVAIRNVKKEYLGDWELIGNIRDSSHNVYRKVQPFSIVDKDAPSVEEVSSESAESEPDPESTPESEADSSSEDAVYEGPGDVRTENRLTYDISLGSTVTVTISHQFMSDSGFGCFLKTPQGDVITFRPTTDDNNSDEDLVLQPVSMISDCSVAIRNVKKEYLGDWELIGDIRDSSHNVYRKVQPFSIVDKDAPSVEEVSSESAESEPDPESTPESEADSSSEDAVYEGPGDVRTENRLTYDISLGSTVTVTISHQFMSDSGFGCFLKTPQGDVITFRPTSDNNNSNEDLVLQPVSMMSDCSVAIRNLKKEYLGDWELIGDIRDSSHNVYRKVQPFSIVDKDAPSVEVSSESAEHESEPESTLESEEDTSTPESAGDTSTPESEGDTSTPESEGDTSTPESTTTLEPEPEVTITTRDPLNFNTALRNRLQIRIPRILTNAFHSCHLRTPEGIDLNVDKDLEYPGLQVEDRDLASNCLIHMTVTEEMNGEWLLYTKESNNRDEPQEIRQPFAIDIEEPTSTFPKDSLTIERGRDLYLRLGHAVTDLVTCELEPPSDDMDVHIVRDNRYADTCGFIVQNVNEDVAGVWQIVAKGRIGYRARVEVSVEDTTNEIGIKDKIMLTQGDPVLMDLGPESALFCQIKDPRGTVVFRGFRRCRLELASVAKHHAGSWSLLMGLPGRLTAVEQTFVVEVEESVGLNVVSERIERGANSLTLSCSMLADRQLTTCKFIRPDSTVFIVHEGVGEGRYSYFGNGARIADSGHWHVECGLHVESPLDVDQGTWRCILEAEQLVSSGFFRTSIADNPVDGITGGAVGESVQNVQTRTPVISVLSDEELVMSCDVAAHLDYCWFRHQNGTVISVAPGVYTPTYEYSGAGFDAGECGIRIHHASILNTGSWTCNVGLDTRNDLGVRINVTVHESAMIAVHRFIRTGKNTLAIIVEGRSFNGSSLEYCRFVTPLGLGFHSHSLGLTSRYSFFGTDLSAGICRVTVDGIGWAEHGVWTVAGRLDGGQEVAGTTYPQHMWSNGQGNFFFRYLLLVTLLVVFNITFIYVLVNKRSRSWTSTRVSAVGNSIRNSFRKSRTSAPTSNDSSNDTSRSNNSFKRSEVEDAPPAYEPTVTAGQSSRSQDQALVVIDELKDHDTSGK